MVKDGRERKLTVTLYKRAKVLAATHIYKYYSLGYLFQTQTHFCHFYDVGIIVCCCFWDCVCYKSVLFWNGLQCSLLDSGCEIENVFLHCISNRVYEIMKMNSYGSEIGSFTHFSLYHFSNNSRPLKHQFCRFSAFIRHSNTQVVNDVLLFPLLKSLSFFF